MTSSTRATRVHNRIRGHNPPSRFRSVTFAEADRFRKTVLPTGTKKLSYYLVKVARLGGYLNRANDPPPGNTVMWRGLSRLTDIALGAMVGAELVGN